MTASALTRTDLATLLTASSRDDGEARQPRRIVRVNPAGVERILNLAATPVAVRRFGDEPKKRVLVC